MAKESGVPSGERDGKGTNPRPESAKWSFGGFLNLVLNVMYTVSLPKRLVERQGFTLFTAVSTDDCIFIFK